MEEASCFCNYKKQFIVCQLTHSLTLKKGYSTVKKDMELVLILFVISVPIFYIKGLISFFSSDKSKGSQKNDRKTYLQTALKELKTLHDPTASIQTVVDLYSN